MAKPFILFEGIDGAGTTTQTNLLYDYLIQKNLPVVKTFEPSGGFIGLMIRDILKKKIDLREYMDEEQESYVLSLLFSADRMEHNYRVIQANENKHVICDRYFFSTIAYQIERITDNESVDKFDWICNLQEYAKEPDIIFFLYCDVDIALKRCKKTDDYELFETKRKLHMVQNNYFYMFGNFERWKAKTVFIDTDKNNIEQVFDIVLEKLGLKE